MGHSIGVIWIYYVLLALPGFLLERFTYFSFIIATVVTCTLDQVPSVFVSIMLIIIFVLSVLTLVDEPPGQYCKKR